MVLALGVSACAHPQARTVPDLPPLDVPPVPARTIAPPPLAEPPPPAAQEPDPSGRKPARLRPPQAKTDPPVPLPPVPPPAAQPPTAPPVAGALQTTSPASQAEMVKTIRDLLARAERDLRNVDYTGLNADGKAQYDTATRFARQAEQALKDQNFVFALTLADKAATLARSLMRRA